MRNYYFIIMLLGFINFNTANAQSLSPWSFLNIKKGQSLSVLPFLGPTLSYVDLEEKNSIKLEGAEANLNLIYVPKDQNILTTMSIGLVGGVQQGKDESNGDKYDISYQELEFSYGPLVVGAGKRTTNYKSEENGNRTVESNQKTISLVIGWPSLFVREQSYSSAEQSLDIKREYGFMFKIPLTLSSSFGSSGYDR